MKWMTYGKQKGQCARCETQLPFGNSFVTQLHHAVVFKSDLPRRQQQERGIDDPVNLLILCNVCHHEIQRDRRWGIERAIKQHGEDAVKAMCQRLLPKTWRNLYKWSAS
jgi:hypothetical protein